MKFVSKAQYRAALAGRIQGVSLDKARDWALETGDIDSLPERAPSRPLVKKAALEALRPLHEAIGQAIVKRASLGTSLTAASNQVGKFKGFVTPHSLKAPGIAASQQAINPRRSITNAINHFKA